jgi:hypothetical protein
MKLSELKSIIRQEVRAVLKEAVIPITAKVSPPTPPISKARLSGMVAPVIEDMAFVSNEQLTNLVFIGTELAIKRLYAKLKEKGLTPYFFYPRVQNNLGDWVLDTRPDMIQM